MHFYMCIRTNQHLGSRGLPIVTVPKAVTHLTELEELFGRITNKFLQAEKSENAEIRREPVEKTSSSHC